jgi:anti-sigma B factor antagonist
LGPPAIGSGHAALKSETPRQDRAIRWLHGTEGRDGVRFTLALRRGNGRGRTMATHRRIDVSKTGDVSVVKFLDRKILDEAAIQELGSELFGLVEIDNRKAILLDFDGVEFLSSAALGKLITFDRKLKTAKGRLKMCGISPGILEVFQVTKLNKVFDIRTDLAEALAAF